MYTLNEREKMIATEKKIVLALVNAFINDGFFIGVDDGGDNLAVWPTQVVDKIMDGLFNTDSASLFLYTARPVVRNQYREAKTQRFGWVFLVFGNGEDVVSDWSAKDRINGIVEKVLDDMTE